MTSSTGLLVLLLLIPAACATPSTSGETSPPNDPATPAAPGMGVAADECVEGGEDPQTQIRTRLDITTRTTTTTAQGGDGFVVKTASRYDEAKRIVVAARWGRSNFGDSYQTDVAYDVHGHVVDSRTSYLPNPALDAPATTETFDAVHHDNTYDTNAVLTRSVATASGMNAYGAITEYLFSENGAGQCTKIETHWSAEGQSPIDQIEERTYDAAGRLVRADYSGNVPRHCPTTAAMHSRTWTYDDQGRLTQERFWCDGTNLEASPEEWKTILHRADGSQRIEWASSLDDTADGVHVTERSAYCAVIDAWLAEPKPSTRCAVPR